MAPGAYIRRYIDVQKEKGLAAFAANPLILWCRQEESNPRPSHYECGKTRVYKHSVALIRYGHSLLLINGLLVYSLMGAEACC